MARNKKELITIILNASSNALANLTHWHILWKGGNATKKRVDFWLKKVGITLEEYEIFLELCK